MRPNNDKRLYLVDDSPEVVYLKNVVNDPDIEVGVHTYYHDDQKDPRDFVKNNVLYHFPGAGDHIKIGSYCSIASGVKFMCAICHHDPGSLAWYPFGWLTCHWDSMEFERDFTWGHRGQGIEVGNDVWIGRESIIMPGVKIGDGAAIGTRSVVTRGVPPYTIVGGVPARFIKKRFEDSTIEKLLELKWWTLPEEEINVLLPALVHGDLEGVFQRKAIYEAAKRVLARYPADL